MMFGETEGLKDNGGLVLNLRGWTLSLTYSTHYSLLNILYMCAQSCPTL